MLMLIMPWMSACKRFVRIKQLTEKAPNLEVHCALFSEEIILIVSTHSWRRYRQILKFSNHIIIVLPYHLMKEQSSFTCHTTEREKISISKILAHLFQKYKKTIHIHKTEGSPEHSQHLRCQWRRELVTTYDSQTAAAWDPSPPMQQPGGAARLTRSDRIGSLHKLSCFCHLDPTHWASNFKAN